MPDIPMAKGVAADLVTARGKLPAARGIDQGTARLDAPLETAGDVEGAAHIARFQDRGTGAEC